MSPSRETPGAERQRSAPKTEVVAGVLPEADERIVEQKMGAAMFAINRVLRAEGVESTPRFREALARAALAAASPLIGQQERARCIAELRQAAEAAAARVSYDKAGEREFFDRAADHLEKGSAYATPRESGQEGSE